MRPQDDEEEQPLSARDSARDTGQGPPYGIVRVYRVLCVCVVLHAVCCFACCVLFYMLCVVLHAVCCFACCICVYAYPCIGSCLRVCLCCVFVNFALAMPYSYLCYFFLCAQVRFLLRDWEWNSKVYIDLLSYFNLSPSFGAFRDT